MSPALAPDTAPQVRSNRLLLASVALTGLTVLLQVAYPLTPDDELGRLSAVTVLTFAAASVTHALATRGTRWTVRLVLVVVPGAFAVEAVGVATGFPFGSYSYAHSLGPTLLAVPLLVPVAWLMMAYPCLLMARQLTARSTAPQRIWARHLATTLVAGTALAAWDILLDPQMVAAGHWAWTHPRPGLPGIAHVPLTNLAGWLLAGTLVMGLADLALPRHPRDELPTRLETVTPAVLLGWTWLGGIVGNAAFFGRPWVAVWGGLTLGLFVVPYLAQVRDRWRA